MIQHSVRFPDDLYQRVKAAAARDRRSVHAEILTLLERALERGTVDAADEQTPAPPTAILTSYRTWRHGRRVLVISDLADLRGPADGKVILPRRLSWSPPGRVWDLDDPWMLGSMYKTVLTESVRPDELMTWINGPRLVEIWPDLSLPKGVQQAWEEHHQVLLGAKAEIPWTAA